MAISPDDPEDDDALADPGIDPTDESGDGADGESTDGDDGESTDADERPGDGGPTSPGEPGDGAPGGDEPAGGDEPWYRAYLYEQSVHIGVILAFALYPFLYVALRSLAPAEMTTILPGIDLMVTVLYFGLFAMSFDFISGYTGYLSFGHAAFYGIGAYFVVLTANGKVPGLPPGTPFLVMLVVAGLAGVLVALLIGALSFRLTGVYFAMITLGFGQVIYVLFQNWDYVGTNPRTGTAVAGGREGFRIGVPFVEQLSLKIGRLPGDTVENFLGTGISLSQAEVSYYMVGLVVLVCYFAMQRIIHSPFGRVMIAIRENEERARAVGYDTYKYKMGAFAISAFFAAVAGGLFAGYRRSVAPDNSLFFLVSGDALLAAIIGGFGTLAGGLFGWLLFESLDEFLSSGVVQGAPDGLLPYLRKLLGPETLSARVGGVEVRTVLEVLFNGRAGLYIGLLFVLFVLYVPNGILGTLRQRLGGTVAGRLPEWLRNRRG